MMKTLLIFFTVHILGISITSAQNNFLEKAIYQQAIIALSEKDTSKAVDLLKKSIKLNKDTDSYFEIAKIYSVKQTHTGLTMALQYLEKAIELEPNNIQYRLLDAKIRENLFYLSKLNLEEREAARNQYRKILEIDSVNYDANFNLGRLLQEDFLEHNRSRVKDEGIRKLSSIEKENLQRSNRRLALIENTKNEFLENNEIFSSLKLDKQTGDMFLESEQYLLRTVKSNPGNSKNVLLLTQLYIDNEVPSKAINFLVALKKSNPSITWLYVYLGLVYHLLNEDEKASREFDEAMIFLNKDEVKDYKYSSVKLLLEPRYGSQIDNMNEDQVANLISNFWQVSDPLVLTSYNERLIEHYSRVAYANLFFGVPGENLPGWQTDRGEILIRYGQPSKKVRYRPFQEVRSSTKYETRGEEYPKAEIWYYADKTFVFEDIYRNNHFRFNNPERGTTQFSNNTSEEVVDYRTQHFQGYTPVYNGPTFSFPFATYQFKSANQLQTDVYLSYQISTKDSSNPVEKFSEGYDVGLFFFDKFLNKKFVDKTTLKPVNNASVIHNTLRMTASPESGSIAFEMIRKKDKGVASYHGKFIAKNFGGQKLMMSDIVCATDVEFDKTIDGSIQRNSISVMPNLAKSYSKDNLFYIYYEVYNLQKGQSNTTDFEQKITIQKKGEDGILTDLLNAVGFDRNGNRVSLSSRYQTREKDTQMYLQLDMSKYESGNYIVTVSVKDITTGNEIDNQIEVNWFQ